MKILRRIVFVLALGVLVICAGLLITAYDPSNPTHRRYSSKSVITETEDTKLIGDSGENVLSKDLGLPRNDNENPRLLICNTKFKNEQKPPKNSKCIHFSDNIKEHRRPDFISLERGIIVDSKNTRSLQARGHDYDQISEFAIAAEELNLTLWIYVRHNTRVETEYNDITGASGGRVILYFLTEQPYFDPIDFQLWRIIAVALGTMVFVLIWESVAKVFSFFTPTPKSSIAISPHKSSNKAKQSVDDYDRFIRNASENARKTLDD